MDYDANEIRLAEATQNEVTPSPANFASIRTDCSGSGLGAGAIAAVVLGVTIGLALIGSLTYCLYRKRRSQTVRGGRG